MPVIEPTAANLSAYVRNRDEIPKNQSPWADLGGDEQALAKLLAVDLHKGVSCGSCGTLGYLFGAVFPKS